MQPNSKPLDATPTSTQTLSTPDHIGSESAFPHRNPKKKLVIIASILAASLVGGVASAMWWTSPEKSFDDALTVREVPSGGTLKGDMTITPSGGQAMKLTFDTQYNGIVTKTDLGFNVSMGALTINLTGGLATTSDKSVMFRVNDLRKTLGTFASDAGEPDSYTQLLDKIDGKWVEVTTTDFKDLTKDSGADVTCLLDKTQKLTRDKAFMAEVAELYKKYPILTVKEKLGSEKIDGRDSNHIVAAYDASKAKSLSEALEKTAGIKDLATCVTDTKSTSSTVDQTIVDPRFELWIDKWSHAITKVVMTQDMEGVSVKFTAVLTYNNNQKVDTPKADTQFKDIQSDVMNSEELFPSGAASDEPLLLEVL
ncbi:MAG: hypothetical protein WBB39_00790 [Candidatus Saccharimonadales bacterium]